MLQERVGRHVAAPVRTDVAFADCFITPQAIAEASRVMSSGWVTTGRQVAAFEQEFADLVGAAHAVAVSSCTAALELALSSLQLPKGSRVLVPSVTFCGAVHAVAHAGLQPVLIDVDPETGMPTPQLTAKAAAGCGGAQALMVVHLAGAPCDVVALADAAGLPLTHVVEDAAHALGTRLRGRHVGSISGATCFSFYATKNLPIGEGGMVVTDSHERADWLRRARLHGMSADAWRRYLPGGSWQYDVSVRGLKANMTDIQAAMGRAQLSSFPQWQVQRRLLAAHYDDRLSGCPLLGLPRPLQHDDDQHAWHLYTVKVRPQAPVQRDDVITRLAERGIGTSVHFIPIHQLSYFQDVVEIPAGGLHGAEAIFPQLLSLPLYPRLTHAQVDQVCDALLEILESPESRRAKP